MNYPTPEIEKKMKAKKVRVWKTPSKSSTRIFKKRITGNDIVYYNPFQKLTKTIVEQKEAGREMQWLVDDWYISRVYAFKINKKFKTKYPIGDEKSAPDLKAIVEDVKTTTEKGIIKGEFFDGKNSYHDNLVKLHVESKKEKLHFVFNPVFFDVILTHYPEAELYLQINNATPKTSALAVFKVKKEVVGIVMCIYSEGTTLEDTLINKYFIKRYKQLCKKEK